MIEKGNIYKVPKQIRHWYSQSGEVYLIVKDLHKLPTGGALAYNIVSIHEGNITLTIPSPISLVTFEWIVTRDGTTACKDDSVLKLIKMVMV